jgi:3-oxoacyl-[acyl-carrier protein] reductase
VEVEIKAREDCLSVADEVGTDNFPKRIVDATVQKWSIIIHIVDIVDNAGFAFDEMATYHARRHF